MAEAAGGRSSRRDVGRRLWRRAGRNLQFASARPGSRWSRETEYAVVRPRPTYAELIGLDKIPPWLQVRLRLSLPDATSGRRGDDALDRERRLTIVAARRGDAQRREARRAGAPRRGGARLRADLAAAGLERRRSSPCFSPRPGSACGRAPPRAAASAASRCSPSLSLAALAPLARLRRPTRAETPRPPRPRRARAASARRLARRPARHGRRRSRPPTALWALHRDRLARQVEQIRARRPRAAHGVARSARAAIRRPRWRDRRRARRRARALRRASPPRSTGAAARPRPRPRGSTPGSIRPPTPTSRRSCSTSPPSATRRRKSSRRKARCSWCAPTPSAFETRVEGALRRSPATSRPTSPPPAAAAGAPIERRWTIRGDGAVVFRRDGARARPIRDRGDRRRRADDHADRSAARAISAAR